jgi:polar amino acid transport system substrate-binding protein
MSNSFKTTLLSSLAIISVLALFFLFKANDDDISINNNNLVVGVSPDYPPFEFTKDGKIVGFDIDLINEIAKTMHMEVKIREMEFSSLIPSLNSGEFDLIISSISRNSDRSENIDFSEPYYASAFTIISKNDQNFSSLEDLPNDAKVGVQTGSTMENFVNNYNDSVDKSLKIISLGSNFILIEQLKLGEIDALVVEDAQASSFVKNIVGLKSNTIEDNVYIDEEESSYVIVLKKDSSLTEKVNQAIENLNNNGQIDLLLKKWNLR